MSLEEFQESLRLSLEYESGPERIFTSPLSGKSTKLEEGIDEFFNNVDLLEEKLEEKNSTNNTTRMHPMVLGSISRMIPSFSRLAVPSCLLACSSSSDSQRKMSP